MQCVQNVHKYPMNRAVHCVQCTPSYQHLLLGRCSCPFPISPNFFFPAAAAPPFFHFKSRIVFSQTCLVCAAVFRFIAMLLSRITSAVSANPTDFKQGKSRRFYGILRFLSFFAWHLFRIGIHSLQHPLTFCKKAPIINLKYF